MAGVNMTFVVGVAWIIAGGYLLASAFRHRQYVQSLPPSHGNQEIRRHHVTFTVSGVAALALGMW
jgi:uncharacterized membrane protein HdeD (DUF308 family)